MRPSPSLLLPASLLALAACTTPATPTDATVDSRPEASVPVDSQPDSLPVDALDASALDAAPPGVACTSVPVVEDLSALGTVTAGVLHYTGTNTAASTELSGCLQAPASCAFRAVSQRLFRYHLVSGAALRVSTNNRGTDSAFDTVLFVTTAPCLVPTANLGCNDDDPTQTGSTHLTGSRVVTAALAAGTDVLIAVSGFYPVDGSSEVPVVASETGTFELTVAEVPVVAAGGACDPAGSLNLCPAGLACVTASQRDAQGTCVAPGSVPGAPCLDGGMCAGSLACDATYNTCYATVAEGAACERYGAARNRCATNVTCLTTVRGDLDGTCVRNGTALFSACSDAAPCTGAGLSCHAGVCYTAAAAGAACNSTDTACPAGQSCLAPAPGGTRGLCSGEGTAPGAACRSGAVECDGSLFCVVRGFPAERLCRSVGLAAGDACGLWGACNGDAECIVTDPTQPNVGVCSPAGALSGLCRTAAPQCDTGLTCVALSSTVSRCRQSAAVGASCSLAGTTTTCPAGTNCVRASLSDSQGACTALGTAAGTACAGASPRCATGLRCTTTTGAGRCVSDVAAGQPCDSRLGTALCTAPSLCRATDLNQGVCDAPVAEVEPDDDPTTAASAAPFAARVIAGSLYRYDLDCYGLDVPAGGGVFAQAVHDAGQCTDRLAFDLYDPAGRTLGTDTNSGPGGCPRIDAGDSRSFAWARGLAGGRYVVCLRENSDRRPVSSYQLSLRAVAP